MPGQRLSGRELEVLRQVAQGLSSLQIAAALGIKESTVKNHRRTIYARLGVHTEVEATLWYFRNYGDPDDDEESGQAE
jgi:DNA-binding CsgD family transcriptional regulator